MQTLFRKVLDVSFGGPANNIFSIRFNLPRMERAIDAIEGKGSTVETIRRHLARAERDQIGIAVHKTHPAPIQDHLDDVASKQGALPPAAQDNAAASTFEVPPARMSVKPSWRIKVSPSQNRSRGLSRITH